MLRAGPHEWDQCLMKETPESFLAPFCRVKTEQEDGHSQTRIWTLTGHRIYWHIYLRFPILQNCEKQTLWLRSPSYIFCYGSPDGLRQMVHREPPRSGLACLAKFTHLLTPRLSSLLSIHTDLLQPLKCPVLFPVSETLYILLLGIPFSLLFM